MFKIVFLSAMFDSSYILKKVCGNLKEEYSKDFEFVFINTYAIDNDDKEYKRTLKEIDTCDLVCLFLHGGITYFKSYHKILDKYKGKKFFFMNSGVEDESRELFNVSNIPSMIFQNLLRYYLMGGEDNFYNMIKYAANKLKDYKYDLLSPKAPLWEGIYYNEKIVDDEYKYLDNIVQQNKPIAAILFYGSYMQKRNVAHIDAFIEEVEKQGAVPLAVFTNTINKEDIGAKGIQWTIDNLLIKDGKVIPDVIINTMVYSQSILGSPGDGKSIVDKSIFEQLNIPVIQALSTYQTYKQWNEELTGVDMMSLACSVYYPEFDGQIISVTTTYSEVIKDEIGERLISLPIKERVNKVCRLALNFAKLKYIPENEKKVAVIFHNMPPRNDMIGCAFGLDTPKSVFNMVEDMKKIGIKTDYDFNDGDEIIQKIIDGVSNDSRWLTAEKVFEKGVDVIESKQYIKWFNNLPEEVQKKMNFDWGEAPGDFMVYDNKLPVPGIINGNIFIGLQPPRGYLEKADDAYHSTELVPPHQYISFYKWIKNVFKADVIVHVGTHGTLEWLPGKEVGLSNKCYPDINIDDIPHLYPYSINITGEGMQVKRRSNGIILSHLIPSMTLSESYDDMDELDNLIKQYYQSLDGDTGKLHIIENQIIEICINNNYNTDLKCSEEYIKSNFREFLDKLHGYIEEIKGSLIKDGLHIFGQCPEDERLNNLIFALLRLGNEKVVSISSAVAKAINYDIDKLKDNPLYMNERGMTNLMILENIDKISLNIIEKYSFYNFKTESIEEVLKSVFNISNNNISNKCIDTLSYESLDLKELIKILKYITNVVNPKLKKTENELKYFVEGVKGNFVPPGGSGCPTRGNINILPSGRNFYSIDPTCIPTRASWKVGKKLGDDLLKRYLDETKEYPESIAIVIYAGETMKTNGDDIAEVLYLMGVKPIWLNGTDKVIGLEVIPYEKLKRPRIDVTLRITGLFRDTFPNIIELVEEGVNLVSQLDEEENINYLKKNINNEIEELLKKGVSVEEAVEEAGMRIFGCPPGTYGAGVDILINSKKWTNRDELGKAYIEWSSFAYGKTLHGKKVTDTLSKRLSKAQITVKNESSCEIDMLESDDYYNYHGGLIAAVKTSSGDSPKSYTGNSSDPSRTKIKDINEETAKIMRSRILNSKWFEGLKKHGYKGAQEISAMVDIIFGWDATSEIIEDWMYDSICEKYIFNKERREWIKKVNTWAMHNMVERLLEANQRGMWNTKKDNINELKKLYMDVEGDIEELV